MLPSWIPNHRRQGVLEGQDVVVAAPVVLQQLLVVALEETLLVVVAVPMVRQRVGDLSRMVGAVVPNAGTLGC